MVSVSAPDCARLLWGESLTLYLIQGTTCLPLLDTGSPHPRPNVEHSTCQGLSGISKSESKSGSSLYVIHRHTAFLTCTFTAGWSSIPCHILGWTLYSSFSGCKEALMDTSAVPAALGKHWRFGSGRYVKAWCWNSGCTNYLLPTRSFPPHTKHMKVKVCSLYWFGNLESKLIGHQLLKCS